MIKTFQVYARDDMDEEEFADLEEVPQETPASAAPLTIHTEKFRKSIPIEAIAALSTELDKPGMVNPRPDLSTWVREGTQQRVWNLFPLLPAQPKPRAACKGQLSTLSVYVGTQSVGL